MKRNVLTVAADFYSDNKSVYSVSLNGRYSINF